LDNLQNVWFSGVKDSDNHAGVDEKFPGAIFFAFENFFKKI